VAPVAAVRLCMAADVRKYSDRDNPGRERAQQRLVNVLAEARAAPGLDDATLDFQEQGDALFALMPPGIDESMVIPTLVSGLRTALRKVNVDLADQARLRLRVSLHRGLTKRAPLGWTGDVPISVHRMLDSEEARAALEETSAADFVLVVPDVLYRDVIAHGYDSLRPEQFRKIDVRVKSFSEQAWLYVDR
jgi:hypothetical protein